jgi:hypothetical protein
MPARVRLPLTISSRKRGKMRMAKGIVVAFVAALLVVAAVGVASAANKAGSKVEITRATGDQDGVDIRGKVTSRRARCERHRTVAVYHDVPPPGPSGNDFKLGETTTNDKGKWRLSSSELPDKVYAFVQSNRRCKSDVSSTEKVDFGTPY